jgi:hypothetical protein
MTVSVTFEYAQRAPDTWRGDVNTDLPSNGARLGLKAARAALKPRGWTSVVLLLDRGRSAPGSDTEG